MPSSSDNEVSVSTKLALLQYRIDLLESELKKLEAFKEDTEHLKQRGKGMFWAYMTAAGFTGTLLSNLEAVKSIFHGIISK